MRYPLALLFLLSCSGCSFPQFISPYKVEIPQGNRITADQVSRLQPGMTRAQVHFLLGTPLLMDIFHFDRWDYLYTNAQGGQLKEKKDFVVYFMGDRVSHFEGDTFPAVVAREEEMPSLD